jgi:hypothetical protein
VVELIHSVLNSRFDVGVTFMLNYFSVRDDVPINSKTFLMINFINLKIKSVQSFRCAYRYKIYICTYIHRSECSGPIRARPDPLLYEPEYI